MRHLVYTLILLSCSYVNSYAQEFRFSTIDSRYGLNQGSINRLVQDNLGFVWLGTEDGLARYDGSKVQVYRNDPDNIQSLPDNVITALVFGRDKRLWVGSEGDGASYYDYSSDQFIRLNNAALGKKVINFFSYKDESAILIQTGNGLFFIDKSMSAKQLLGPQQSAKIINVLSSEQGVYALLNTGERIDFTEGGLTKEKSSFFDGRVKYAWPGIGCPRVIYDEEGAFNCLENNNHPVNRLTNDLQLAGLDLATLRISDFIETDDETFWLASNIGLIRVKSGQVSISKNIPNEPHSLSSNKLNKLLMSKGGKLFIGADFKGLSILDLTQQGVEYYRTTNSSKRFKSGTKFVVIKS